MERKRWFLAMAFVIALTGSAAWSVEYDFEALQARLAAQEARMADQDARLNDLNAKIAQSAEKQGNGTADNIISLQKNATVTIGGLVTTKYTFQNAKLDSVYTTDGDVSEYGYRRAATSKSGSLEVSDAELYFAIEVNDHFDAFLEIDLHNGINSDYANAKAYWVRWKNICDTGFGIKVGRDALVFGEEGVGELGSYAAGSGDGLGEIEWGDAGSVMPPHNGWDVDGVVQVTPYWESSDGKFLAELSFIQNIDNETGPRMEVGTEGSFFTRYRGDDKTKYRGRSYGSVSGRFSYTPNEDLKFTLGFVNYRSNGVDYWSEAYYWSFAK